MSKGWGILVPAMVLLWAGAIAAADAPATRPAAPLRDAGAVTFRNGPELHGVWPDQLPDKLELKWKFKTGDAVRSSAVPVGSGGPEGGETAAPLVVIGSTDNSLYALNAKTGEKAWSFAAQDSFEAPPLVVGSMVYAGSDDASLYALDARTGAKKWEYKTEAKIVGSANAVASPRGDQATWIIVGSWDNNLHCVDAATGAPVWKVTTGGPINGAPAVSATGMIAVGGCDDFVHAISITGESISQTDVTSQIPSTIATAGMLAFAGTHANTVVCVDMTPRPGATTRPNEALATAPTSHARPEGGRDHPNDVASTQPAELEEPPPGRIVWSYKDREQPYMTTPAIGATRIVIGCDDGAVHCIDRASGKAVWTFAARKRINSSPIIAGDKVIAGSDDGRLYLIRLSDGKEVWSYEVGKAIQSAPTIVNGLVIFGCDDGYVYALGG